MSTNERKWFYTKKKEKEKKRKRKKKKKKKRKKKEKKADNSLEKLITDTAYTDGLALLANTLLQTESATKLGAGSRRHWLLCEFR